MSRKILAVALVALAAILSGCSTVPRPRVAASVSTVVDGVECAAKIEL